MQHDLDAKVLQSLPCDVQQSLPFEASMRIGPQSGFLFSQDIIEDLKFHLSSGGSMASYVKRLHFHATIADEKRRTAY